MSRRRGPRSHRRGRRLGWSGWSTAGVLVLALAFVFVPPSPSGAAAFSNVDAPRAATVPVATDESGLLGLDVAQNVSVGSADRLVTVTNHLDTSATVTVAIRSGSTDVGDLVVGGTATGDVATVSLAAGGQETVSVAVLNDSSLAGRTLAFDVAVDESGLAIDAPNRTVEVVDR